ncbi:MAG: hypothetical protein Q8O14_05280 [bacterium]|jgi:hypothetical protein|nr:hypothetical protein [bacterium]
MRIPAEFVQYRDRIRNSTLWNLRLEDMERDELLAVIGYLCDRAARSALHLMPPEVVRPRVKARIGLRQG